MQFAFIKVLKTICSQFASSQVAELWILLNCLPDTSTYRHLIGSLILELLTETTGSALYWGATLIHWSKIDSQRCKSSFYASLQGFHAKNVSEWFTTTTADIALMKKKYNLFDTCFALPIMNTMDPYVDLREQWLWTHLFRFTAHTQFCSTVVRESCWLGLSEIVAHLDNGRCHSAVVSLVSRSYPCSHDFVLLH